MKVKKLTAAEIKQHETVTGNEPAVYVGTYGKYNDGSIDGMWVNITSFETSKDFYNFCRRLHADESDPELMFQDYDNIPKNLQSECMGSETIDKIISLYRDYDENDREAVCEYWDEIDGSEEIDKIIDSIIYHGDFSDFAAETADEYLHGLDGWIVNYFNYDAFERDLTHDYHITSNYVFSA